MNCPECKDELRNIDFKGVVIGECPSCHGRWFDRGELKKVKDQTNVDLEWLDFDPFDQNMEHVNETPEGILCPKCNIEMFSIPYDNSDIFIDKCEQCRGVWLHHNEFEKIINYLENLVTSESTTELALESVHQFIEVLQHKKDVTTGVRDFLLIMSLIGKRVGIEHPNLSKGINSILNYLPFL